MAAVFEEVVSVESNDTRLIWLSDVGKDDVHHPWGEVSEKHKINTRNSDIINISVTNS